MVCQHTDTCSIISLVRQLHHKILIKSVCYQNQRYFPETQNKRTNKEEMIKISYIWIKITNARLEFSVKLRITSDLSLLQ